ncbi:MAG: GyrI-like domain-containing protein [Myxococcota bacterium]
MPLELVDVEPSWAAVARRVTRWTELPSAIASAMRVDFGALRALQSGHNIFVYRPGPDGTVELGCGFQVAGPFEPTGEVQPGAVEREIVCDAIPGGRAAHAVHIGPYHELKQTWDPLLDAIRAAGLPTDGVQWEVYGDWHEDPACLRTDVYVRVG